MDELVHDTSPASLWPKNVIDGIFEDISAGATVNAACAKPGRPTKNTLYRWLASDPKLSDRYADAVREQVRSRFLKQKVCN